jgi:hypothetical protein
MAALDKARLRRALRALQAVPVAPEDATIVAQESLDVLAMLAGLKPVYVLGRGYDHPAWLAGVRAVAGRERVHVVEGPCWESPDTLRGLPEWYAAHTRAALAKVRAFYVYKTRATGTAVEEACATGAPTIAEEARLLGFPECCVADHHARLRIFHDLTLAWLERRAGGDEAAMKRLLEAGVELRPEGTDEETALERALALAVAPFTSINMCVACAKSATSPAMRLAERYGDLAAAIDPDYFAGLAP